MWLESSLSPSRYVLKSFKLFVCVSAEANELIMSYMMLLEYTASRSCCFPSPSSCAWTPIIELTMLDMSMLSLSIVKG